jgi:hypothetical protein
MREHLQFGQVFLGTWNRDQGTRRGRRNCDQRLDLPCRAGGADGQPPAIHEPLLSSLGLDRVETHDDEGHGNSRADVA